MSFADESGNFGPRPIEDPDHVDERRKAVGLQPLSEYAREVEQSYRDQHIKPGKTYVKE